VILEICDCVILLTVKKDKISIKMEELIMRSVDVLDRRIDEFLELTDRLSSRYWEYYSKVEQYNPHAWFGIFYGVMLLFFGRNFIITFTVLEAVRLSGSASVMTTAEKLQRRLRLAKSTGSSRALLTEQSPDEPVLTKRDLLTKLSKLFVSVFAVSDKSEISQLHCTWIVIR